MLGVSCPFFIPHRIFFVLTSRVVDARMSMVPLAQPQMDSPPPAKLPSLEQQATVLYVLLVNMLLREHAQSRCFDHSSKLPQVYC